MYMLHGWLKWDNDNNDDDDDESDYQTTVYQILHFSMGFMGELAGQLNALANSTEFETVPMTRKRGGECWSTDNDKCNESAVDFEHQVYKNKKK